MNHTITALEVQANDRERVNVFLDGAFAWGLPAIEAARLHIGQVLTDAEIAALQQREAVARAVDRAVLLLARRPYSTAELRRHLQTKAFAAPVIDEALNRLGALGYVDDRAFAEFWVASRDQSRPRGPRALRYELRQKGIPQAIIDAVLEPLDVQDAAYRAAQPKVRRLRGLTPAEFRTRLGTFLVQRGFDYETTQVVTDTLIEELSEQQPEYFAPHHTSEE